MHPGAQSWAPGLDQYGRAWSLNGIGGEKVKWYSVIISVITNLSKSYAVFPKILQHKPRISYAIWNHTLMDDFRKKL